MTTSGDYQRELGERLRAIRAQQDLTLQDVEDRSDGRWKAVVVGSYERGDRAITISKLAELARFYGVPLTDLLPRPEVPGTPTDEAPDEPQLVIDLNRLEDSVEHDPELTRVHRYTRRIQLRRGDYNGQVLTLRANDLTALAAVLDAEPDDLIEQLSTRAILRGAH